jgi:hypothetical protein
MSNKKGDEGDGLSGLFVFALSALATGWLIKKIVKKKHRDEKNDEKVVETKSLGNTDSKMTSGQKIDKQVKPIAEVNCPWCGKKVKKEHLRICSHCGQEICIYCLCEDGRGSFEWCNDCYTTVKCKQCRDCREWVPQSEYVVCSMCDKGVCRECAYDDNFCSSECESTYN